MRLIRPMMCGCLFALCLGGWGAVAQEAAPVSTAPVSTASEDAAIDAWIKSAANDPGPASSLSDAPFAEPRRIHGEIGGAVGSNGYRSAYGSVWVPFGEASSVSVAGTDEQWKSRRWGRGERRSLALGIYLDGGDVAHFFDRRRCNPHPWAVDLKEDPVINADGSCDRQISAKR